jgi:hypothetical protein
MLSCDTSVSASLVEQSARNCRADIKKAVSSTISCVNSELLNVEKLSDKTDRRGPRAAYCPCARRLE